MKSNNLLRILTLTTSLTGLIAVESSYATGQQTPKTFKEKNAIAKKQKKFQRYVALQKLNLTRQLKQSEIEENDLKVRFAEKKQQAVIAELDKLNIVLEELNAKVEDKKQKHKAATVLCSEANKKIKATEKELEVAKNNVELAKRNYEAAQTPEAFNQIKKLNDDHQDLSARMERLQNALAAEKDPAQIQEYNNQAQEIQSRIDFAQYTLNNHPLTQQQELFENAEAETIRLEKELKRKKDEKLNAIAFAGQQKREVTIAQNDLETQAKNVENVSRELEVSQEELRKANDDLNEVKITSSVKIKDAEKIEELERDLSDKEEDIKYYIQAAEDTAKVAASLGKQAQLKEATEALEKSLSEKPKATYKETLEANNQLIDSFKTVHDFLTSASGKTELSAEEKAKFASIESKLKEDYDKGINKLSSNGEKKFKDLTSALEKKSKGEVLNEAEVQSLKEYSEDLASTITALEDENKPFAPSTNPEVRAKDEKATVALKEAKAAEAAAVTSSGSKPKTKPETLLIEDGGGTSSGSTEDPTEGGGTPPPEPEPKPKDENSQEKQKVTNFARVN
ncbi:MAG: hypothetical protein SFT68_00095, partial [Rickettsiaceae bacterium]|nr:hypothetical protein [Rickettsiaceae bacterium]